MKTKDKPKIALTAGDPAGVGPEIVLKCALDPYINDICVPFCIGSLQVFSRVASKLNIDIRNLPAFSGKEFNPNQSAPALIDPTKINGMNITPGTVSSEGGTAAYRSFTWAVEKAMESAFSAVSTGPLNKEALKLAGVRESGHTEILARMCGSSNYAMLYWSNEIAVSLVTIHHALSEIPGILTEDLVYRTAELTHAVLEKMLGRKPVIAVLGLNPHSGENGHFGSEESKIIEPAICRLIENGIDARGPVPADTAFTTAALQVYDGIVAMYHDQGSIPFKMLHFEDGVNHTMGVPVIRTSVDHGTAFDIAWQGTASTGSMKKAIEMAVLLVESE